MLPFIALEDSSGKGGLKASNDKEGEKPARRRSVLGAAPDVQKPESALSTCLKSKLGVYGTQV